MSKQYIAAMSREDRVRKIIEHSDNMISRDSSNNDSFVENLKAGWLNNLAMFEYNAYNGIGNFPVTLNDGSVLEINVNHLRNLALHQYAMVINNRSAMQAMVNPNTDPMKSIDVAAIKKAGDAFLKDCFENKRFDRAVNKAALFAIQTGTGGTFTKMDPFRGASEFDAYDENGAPVRNGDVVCRPLSPFQIYGDPMETDPTEMPYWVVTYFENKYKMAAQHQEYAEQILNWSTKSKYIYGNSMSYQDLDSNMVLVREYYHRRVPFWLPNGQHAMVVGDTGVFDGDNPYVVGNENNDLPVAVMRPIERANTWYGQTLIDDLVPLQFMYNAVASAMATKFIMFGLPSLVGSDSSMKHLTLSSGIHYYAGVSKEEIPQILDFLIIKPEELNLLALWKNEMETIMGISPIDRGQNPNDIKAGVAMQVLQAQGVKFNSPIFGEFLGLNKYTANFALKIAKKFFAVPVQTAVMGQSGVPEFTEYGSESLASVVSIYSEPVNPLSQTTGGQISIAEALNQQGQLDTPQDLVSVYSGKPLPESYQAKEKENNYLLEENELLKKGIPIPVNPFDNHQVHIVKNSQVFNDPKLRLDWMQGAEPGRSIYQEALNHVSGHLQQMQALNMAMAPPMPGASPGAQGAPPPPDESMQMQAEAPPEAQMPMPPADIAA